MPNEAKSSIRRERIVARDMEKRELTIFRKYLERRSLKLTAER